MTPETGPPSGTEASLASDSRKTCTLPGAGRPSTTLICDNGALGSSLSSHNIVGDGHEQPDIQAIIAALAIEQRNQLIEPGRRPTGA